MQVTVWRNFWKMSISGIVDVQSKGWYRYPGTYAYAKWKKPSVDLKLVLVCFMDSRILWIFRMNIVYSLELDSNIFVYFVNSVGTYIHV